MHRRKIFFIIRSLERGGAERQLVELVRALDKNSFRITVVTFYSGGGFFAEAASIPDVDVVSLNKRSRWDLLGPLWRLWRLIRKIKPCILHSYMGGTNELCLLAGILTRVPVVWGLRASNVDFSHYERLSRWSFRLAAILSPLPDLIIANSNAGKDHHVACGYSDRRMIVVPNGIDTDHLYPDRLCGKRLRDEWDVSEEVQLIGLVGRLDPMKGHQIFLQAAARLAEMIPAIRFVCVGTGETSYTMKLRAMAADLGLEDRLIWAGLQSEMRAVYNALNVSTSASYGEGFSNAIAESMACGVICISTDVGDSALIVGDKNWIVPPNDPEALCDAWSRFLGLSNERKIQLSTQLRERIVGEFSTQRLAAATESALLGCLSSSTRRAKNRV